jgi:hypothetical protein
MTSAACHYGATGALMLGRAPGIPSRDSGHQGPYGPEELLPPLNSLTFGRTSVR